MFVNDLPLLSLLIWLPIVGGLVILMTGDDYNAPRARLWALVTTLVCLVLAIVAYLQFDFTTAAMQFVEKDNWIERYQIFYHLGVDGIAFPLILLTTFMSLIVVIAGWQVIQVRVAQYLAAFLIMQGLMCGVFAARDAMLFYVFWEAMLIPMFIIIGIWGGSNRVYATIKFFLYTFLGSVFMLIALLYLYWQSGSFALADFQAQPLSLMAQIPIFLAFLIAFAVKVPMWPVHTWLPDAHVQAPTGGSVILAAIMLKMGGYGFLRFSLPITPDASAALAGFMITLSLIAVVYIGFVAIVQQDMKKLIAYSSIAHMGFVTLGFFMIFAIVRNSGESGGAIMALEGGMVQMISHGFISAGLFLCVGVLYDRMHTREINDYGGVANTMPVFAAMTVVFIMANSGLPGTSGFVGEFLVIISAFQAHVWIAILAASILILGPAYNLWLAKRVLYGEIKNDAVARLQDINRREFFILGLLLILVLVFGIWPAPMLDMMHPSIEHVLSQALQSKL